MPSGLVAVSELATGAPLWSSLRTMSSAGRSADAATTMLLVAASTV